MTFAPSPPNRMVQNAAVVRSKRKSSRRNFPADSAISFAPFHPPGTSKAITTRHSTAPPTRTITWSTSVQMTASMPPRTVYTTHRVPMSRMQTLTSIPVTTDRASDGRNSTMPIRPNWKSMNITLPSRRAARLKRFSRYSYAVVTFRRR